MSAPDPSLSNQSFWGDPQNMALFGALGNVLAAGGTPMRGMKGMGAGNALAMLAGAGMQGASTGAQAAQQFQKEDIGNQMGQLGLDQANAMQPLMLKNIQNMSNGTMGAPGALGGQAMSQSDQMFAIAYQNAIMSKDWGKASSVMQSWAEHNPELAGAIEKQKALSGITQSPNGPVWGSMVPGASPPASQPPTPQGVAQPPVQGPQTIPPVNASQLQPPPSPSQIPNNPFAAQATAIPPFNPMSAVSVAEAKKTGEDKAANLAEAQKTYNVMASTLPVLSSRLGAMTDANKAASFGPMNTEGGAGPVTIFHDAMNDPTSVANAKLQQLTAQNILPEIGPALQQAGVKGNKFLETLSSTSSGVDLSKGSQARQAQIDGLMRNYIQNLKSTHDQVTGLGGNPPPLASVLAQVYSTPDAVKDAYKRNVIDKDTAKLLLQQNHGFQ